MTTSSNQGDHEPGNITCALAAVQAGVPGAPDTLYHLVHRGLRASARRLLRSQASDALVQTTAVVDDAFLRLIGQRRPWQNRVQFFAMAATMLHRVISDFARRRRRAKRGGDCASVPLEECLAALLPDPGFLLDLDRALERLGAQLPRWRAVAEMRIFGGLDHAKIAAALGVSASTVEHDWGLIRPWLHRELA